MAKDGNTYAKRQRETLKRQKAEAKRDRRKKRKENPGLPGDPFGQSFDQAESGPDVDGLSPAAEAPPKVNAPT